MKPLIRTMCQRWNYVCLGSSKLTLQSTSRYLRIILFHLLADWFWENRIWSFSIQYNLQSNAIPKIQWTTGNKKISSYPVLCLCEWLMCYVLCISDVFKQSLLKSGDYKIRLNNCQYLRTSACSIYHIPGHRTLHAQCRPTRHSVTIPQHLWLQCSGHLSVGLQCTDHGCCSC